MLFPSSFLYISDPVNLSAIQLQLYGFFILTRIILESRKMMVNYLILLNLKKLVIIQIWVQRKFGLMPLQSQTTFPEMECIMYL